MCLTHLATKQTGFQQPCQGKQLREACQLPHEATQNFSFLFQARGREEQWMGWPQGEIAAVLLAAPHPWSCRCAGAAFNRALFK